MSSLCLYLGVIYVSLFRYHLCVYLDVISVSLFRCHLCVSICFISDKMSMCAKLLCIEHGYLLNRVQHVHSTSCLHNYAIWLVCCI